MITINISIGEAIDRLSILLLKEKYIKEKEKLEFIKKEIAEIRDSINKFNIDEFLKEMIQINENMWICNEIRKQKILKENFDKEYLELTIQESIVNDKRFLLKEKINIHFNSSSREQKSYTWLT